MPEPVDPAVIVTPPATMPDLVADCGRRRIGGALVISAGFKEAGPGRPSNAARATTRGGDVSG